ncbi:MAG: hypothetical protein JF616_10250 [Fibrobacteres bacterium]|nr:hypothetical protein [Fibrobacterota bacterium]
MNPEDIAHLKKAAAGLESALEILETWLQSSNGRSVYQASLSMAIAMRHLHDADPEILTANGRKRIEEVLLEEKQRVKTDRFQTGF